MKELFLVRHGKSDWDFTSILDIDRSLKERGIHDGYLMSERLLKDNKLPDLIISSPAVRALHSASIFARTFNYPYSKIVIHKEIYNTGITSIFQIIKQTHQEINSLMVFGHNPTFTDLANRFLNNQIDNIPTTGVVGLKFEINAWDQIENIQPKEWFFDYPKRIR